MRLRLGGDRARGRWGVLRGKATDRRLTRFERAVWASACQLRPVDLIQLEGVQPEMVRRHWLLHRALPGDNMPGFMLSLLQQTVEFGEGPLAIFGVKFAVLCRMGLRDKFVVFHSA